MMKQLMIILIVVFGVGLSACSQNWYDNNKHRTSYKKPITHKIQPHQKEPQH